MTIANRPALLLNADYRPLSHYPLSTIPWEQSIKLAHEKIVTVVEEYEDVVHSPSTTMRIPSVVALNRYVKQPQHVAFTKFNVFLRDRFRCQYCGEKHMRDLTFDHVLPRSHGGLTTWENIVASCWECNMLKDNNKNIVPKRMPFKPTAGQLIEAQKEFPPNYLHETWVDYLYWDSELQAS